MSDAGPSSHWQPPPGPSHSSTLYPATVLQLLRAEQQHPNSNFFLDGIKLDRVTCVACIVNTYEYDLAKVYILEDCSAGRLRVFLGSETRRLLEEAQDFGKQVYVRVMGRLKVFNGVNQLNAEQIRPVLDMHEPFFHCLEAVVAFVSNQRISQSAPPAQLTTPVVSQSPPSMQRAAQTNSRTEDTTTRELGLDLDTTLEGLDLLTLVDFPTNEDLHDLGFPPQPFQSPSPPPSLSSTSADSPSEQDNQPAPSLLVDPYSSLSLLQRDILIQIHDNVAHFPDGVPIATMYRLTGRPTVGESEIRQAIEDLMDCGHLYSTVEKNLFLVD